MAVVKRSRLHKSIKKKLGLSKLGFKSERWIGKYRCDEVNYDHKLIVEINGDAVHGNPRLYSSGDLLPYDIKADDKWTNDADRRTFLETHGWHVIVIWESDSLLEKKKLIEAAMRVFVK